MGLQDPNSDYYNTRRTSLPAIHFTFATATPSSRPTFRQDNTLYESLKAFTFGAPVAPSPDTQPSDTVDTTMRDADEVEPPIRDEGLRNYLQAATARDIQDGGRRPSVPINIPAPTPSPHSKRLQDSFDAAMTAFDNDVDMSFSPPSPTKLPSTSEPGYKARPPALSPAAGYDLAYIFGNDSAPATSYNSDSIVTPGPTPGPIARLYGSSSFSYGSSSSRTTNPAVLEDSFARFVHQHDEEYRERRLRWSCMPHNQVEAGDPTLTGVWNCAPLGKFWISKERDYEADSAWRDGATRENAIVIKSLGDRGASQSSRSPPTYFDTHIHVHKHSRVPAYSLLLGPWNPRAAAKSSLLLAPKSVHLRLTSSQKRSGRKRGLTMGASSGREMKRKNSLGLGEVRSALEPSPPSQQSSSSSSPLRQPLVPPTPSRPESLDCSSFPRHPPPPGFVPSFVKRESSRERSTKVTRDPWHYATDFEILPAEKREELVEYIVKHNEPTSLGDRIFRAFTGSSSHPHVSSHGSKTPPAAPHEGVYSPPWMLLTPDYVKEDNSRRVRKAFNSLESAGLIQAKKLKRISVEPKAAAAYEGLFCAGIPMIGTEPCGSPRREERSGMKKEWQEEWQSIRSLKSPVTPKTVSYDGLPSDAYCMAIPLWNYRADQRMDDLYHPRSQSRGSSSEEKQWLVVYYLPFNESRTSPRATTFRHRSPSASLPSSSHPSPTASTFTTSPLRSFRVVAQRLSDTELAHSGLRHPLAAQAHASASSAGATSHSSASCTVIAMCEEGACVEFIPEGLESLGLCDDEQLTVVGKEVVEIAWAGSLALMDWSGDAAES
jgi:hypothetical protein